MLIYLVIKKMYFFEIFFFDKVVLPTMDLALSGISGGVTDT